MMTECNTCWGTGRYKGWGAPCKEGCKPPDKKHGLAAVTAPDAAPTRAYHAKDGPMPDDWKCSPVKQSRKAMSEADRYGYAVGGEEMVRILAGKAETEALKESRARYQTGGKVPKGTAPDAGGYVDADGTMRNYDGTRSIFDDVDQ